MPFFILPVLAAALVGGFTSFWITLAAAFAIGITQSEFTAYVSDTGFTWGFKQTLPFLVIIVLLVVRGEGLPVRGQVVERLAELGNGKVRWGWLAGVVGRLRARRSCYWFDDPAAGRAHRLVRLGDRDALGRRPARLHRASCRSRSSRSPGSRRSSRRVSSASGAGRSSSPSLVAVAVTIPVGLLFAIPALRTRGINLAVVTLGLAMGVNAMIFTNTKWVGASGFTAVAAQTPLRDRHRPDHARRPLRDRRLRRCSSSAALAVASIRRGVVGRRLIAVRTNERAAAALGISVFGVKLYAFAFGAAIAAIGGVDPHVPDDDGRVLRLHAARVDPRGRLHGDRRRSASCSARRSARSSSRAASAPGCSTPSPGGACSSSAIVFAMLGAAARPRVRGGAGTARGATRYGSASAPWCCSGSAVAGLVLAVQEGAATTAGGRRCSRTRTRAGSS